jgi:ATP-dependent Lon protease
MQESARAALSYVRSRAETLGIDPEFYEKTDIHLHVPAGAQRKDGPSAGVTMATALVSLLTRRRVRKGIGMTGEITLRGRVLPIGGLKEKILAAHRFGLRTIVFPKRNETDLDDIPNEVIKVMEFIPVETVAEVLEVALEKKPVAKKKRKKKEKSEKP